VTVARVGEIPEGGRKMIRIEDQELAVFLIGGKYYAIDDVCTHDGGPVAEGRLDGAVIECPRHGATFDVRTGAALTFPAVSPVPTYAVRVVGDDVQVEWP
jgi:3-phenylpropionate/trans-cinnamate dioxygenase ferredoxin subunit